MQQHHHGDSVRAKSRKKLQVRNRGVEFQRVTKIGVFSRRKHVFTESMSTGDRQDWVLSGTVSKLLEKEFMEKSFPHLCNSLLPVDNK